MSRFLDDLDSLRFYSTLEVLRLLPLNWAMRWMRVSAAIAYRLRPDVRREAAAWLKAAIPGDGRAGIVREQFTIAAYRRYLSYLLMLGDARDHAPMLEVDDWDRVEAALAGNRGVVLLSSKLGVPRLLRWYLRTRDVPVLYLLRIGFPRPDDKRFRHRFGLWHRTRYMLEKDDLGGYEDLSVRFMKRALEHLRGNGIVNIAGDGTVDGARHPVSILGRRHTFAEGGIALGLLSGAPVIPCFTVVERGPRFRLEIQEPLCVPDGQRREQTARMVREYAERIARYIQSHPESAVTRKYSVDIPA